MSGARGWSSKTEFIPTRWRSGTKWRKNSQ